jgi:hypothetical protein
VVANQIEARADSSDAAQAEVSSLIVARADSSDAALAVVATLIEARADSSDAALEAAANEIEARADSSDAALEVVDGTTLAILGILDIALEPLAKNAGCDGLDQDHDDHADNCSEDLFPPEIALLPSSGADRHERTGTGEFRFPSKIFKSNEEAVRYLDSATKVTDDCAPSAQLAKAIELVGGTCQDTKFRVTPQHNCKDSLSKDAYDTKSGTAQDFLLNVDDTAPKVTCRFDNAVGMSLTDGDKTLFIEEDDAWFVTELFIEVLVSICIRVTTCRSRCPVSVCVF